MPFVLNDRVLEISTTTGTVPFVLGGPPSGYQSFLSGIGGSNTTFYAAFNTTANEWELGLGTLNAGATELTRTTIYSSSNSNLVVNFSAGTKNVFVALPSSQTLTANQSNIFTAAQTFRAANAVRSEAAATQDAVVLAGRAGGTSSYAVSLTPTTLSASRTVTLPDANTTLPIATQSITFSGPTTARTYTFPDANSTVAALGTAQTFTAAQTFRAANAIRSEAAATQDAVVVAGRAGGTSSFAITLTPDVLTGNRTFTLPEPGENVTVGYLNIPQNSKSVDYTLVASDAGKHIFHPSADTTPRTFTIPANGTVPYAVGTTITFINQNGAGAVTIAITSDTMRLAGSGATGSRTLAANGIATCIKVTSTEWLISGTGLT